MEELTYLRQELAAPSVVSFLRSQYEIDNENKIRLAIKQTLEQYQQDHNVAVLFKEISHIIDNDVKYLVSIDQESDAYLPLLLSLRENIVVNLIRELNLNTKGKEDRAAALYELAQIYHYLQHHFKNSDWFDNPEAYKTTCTSNFRILAKIDEQSWSEAIHNQVANIKLN